MNKAIANLVRLTPNQYYNIHRRMEKVIPCPALCPECGITAPIQLANISGIYSFNPKDWKWLCSWCHMLIDGTLSMQQNTLQAKIEKILKPKVKKESKRKLGYGVPIKVDRSETYKRFKSISKEKWLIKHQ